MSRFGPRSLFSCSVDIERKCRWAVRNRTHTNKHTCNCWLPKIWYLKKYYDRVVIRGASWQECIPWPVGRFAAGLISVAQLSPGRRQSDADERCWQQAAVNIWASASVQHGETAHCFPQPPSGRLHQTDEEIVLKVNSGTLAAATQSRNYVWKLKTDNCSALSMVGKAEITIATINLN